jgi:hypothetical protein
MKIVGIASQWNTHFTTTAVSCVSIPRIHSYAYSYTSLSCRANTCIFPARNSIGSACIGNIVVVTEFQCISLRSSSLFTISPSFTFFRYPSLFQQIFGMNALQSQDRLEIKKMDLSSGVQSPQAVFVTLLLNLISADFPSRCIAKKEIWDTRLLNEDDRKYVYSVLAFQFLFKAETITTLPKDLSS